MSQTSSTADSKKPEWSLVKSIFEHLDEHFHGQEETKKAISLGYFNHFKRIAAHNWNSPSFSKKSHIGYRLDELRSDLAARESNHQFGKDNMLFIGPTGSGKTEMARTVAKYLGLPFTVCDCATLTQADSIQSVFNELFAHLHLVADRDHISTSWGIVFLAGIDKLKTTGESLKCSQIQEELLKLIEGKELKVTYGRGKKDYLVLDTTNILFIGSGQFDGLEEIVRNRLDIEHWRNGTPRSSSVCQDTWVNYTQTCDLVKYRMLPVLAALFVAIIPFKPPGEQALLDILTRPKNSLLGEFKRSFQMDGVELSFDEDAIKEIAKIALEKKTGVRGLKAILQNVLRDVMFEASGSSSTRALVTRDSVLGKNKVQLV